MKGCGKGILWGLAALGLFVCAQTLAEELWNLPIGHLDIQKRDDGMINVSARCIPLTDLAEALSGYLGKPVIFDYPCRSYVSLHNPDNWMPAAKWLDLGVGLATQMKASAESDGYHVRRIGETGGYDPSDYDPALSDQEIQAVAALPRPVAPTPETGIESGVLIFRGHYVPGPYEVAHKQHWDKTCTITVNGLPVLGLPAWNKLEPYGKPILRPLPDSGQFEDRQKLRDYLMGWLSSGDLANVPWEEARPIVIEFLRGQKLIDIVLTPDMTAEEAGMAESQFRNVVGCTSTLLCRFRGAPVATGLLPCNFDVHKRRIANYAPYSTAEAQEKQAEKAVASLERSLSRGAIHFAHALGHSVDMGGLEPTSRLLGLCSQEMLAQPLLARECLFYELVADREMARELAVNLPQYGGALASALEGILQNIEAAKAEQKAHSRRKALGIEAAGETTPSPPHDPL